MTKRRFLVPLTAVILATSASAFDSVDYVAETGKKATARGTIRDENKREIVLQTSKGDEIRVPFSRIESVKYDNQPPELITIRSKIDRGDYEESIQDLRNLGKSIDERDTRLQAMILFQILRAANEWAKADPTKTEEALKWFNRLEEGFPNSRYHYPAQEIAGQIYLTTGDYEKAAKAFSSLREVDDPAYRIRAAVLEGLCQLRQNRTDEALRHFEDALAIEGKGEAVERQRSIALAYKGQGLVAKGKSAEAEPLLRQAIEAMPPEAVDPQAIAHNALGDALLAAKRPKEALLDGYLKVCVLFDKNREELARALYQSAQICRTIGRKDRADEMIERLKTEFPTSPWTKKATGG